MPEIQDFVDSLCQCFGTTSPPHSSGPDRYRRSIVSVNSKQQNVTGGDRQSTICSSSEGKKASNRKAGTGCSSILVLPERQLEALKLTSQRVSCFHDVLGDSKKADVVGLPHQSKASSPSVSRKLQKKNSKSGRLSSSSSSNNNNNTMNGSNHSAGASHKRRRSSNGSSRVDDIFRSKTRTDSGFTAAGSGNCNNSGTQPSTFSRFLSNHPAIMNSLCFATPVKGESVDDHNPSSAAVPVDAQSVISQCDDEEDDNTMTSTVFYETTKLAGLRQTSPPMPLFKHFAVDPERDDINKIVTTHSHSSAKLIDMFRNFHESCLQNKMNELEETKQEAHLSKGNPPMVPVSSIKLDKLSATSKQINRNTFGSPDNHGCNSRMMRNGNSWTRSKVGSNIDPLGVLVADDFDDMNPPAMMHCSSSASKSSKSSGGCDNSD